MSKFILTLLVLAAAMLPFDVVPLLAPETVFAVAMILALVRSINESEAEQKRL